MGPPVRLTGLSPLLCRLGPILTLSKAPTNFSRLLARCLAGVTIAGGVRGAVGAAVGAAGATGAAVGAVGAAATGVAGVVGVARMDGVDEVAGVAGVAGVTGVAGVDGVVAAPAPAIGGVGAAVIGALLTHLDAPFTLVAVEAEAAGSGPFKSIRNDSINHPLKTIRQH